MIRRLLISCACLLVLTEWAFASSNLPIHHWAYDAIERLNALGLLDHAMVVTKPYTRKEAARYVSQLMELVRANQVKLDGREEIAERLLRRLRSEFRPELEELGILPRRDPNPPTGIRYGLRVQSEADYFSVGGGQTVRFRENRGGEYYANGAQNQTDVRGWVELGNWLTLTAQPKFISDEHALGIGTTNNSHNVYMRETTVKVTHWNVSFEIGRGSQWWGPGYRGTMLLSDHAFPLEMMRLYSDEAFRLPGRLAGLGEWKVHSFLARLDADRDFPRAKVFGLRIAYTPAKWIEFGLSRLTQFDGSGRDQSFPSTVIHTYFSDTNQGGANAVNEQAMFDMLARIPRKKYLVPFPAGMQFYLEAALEDPPYGLGGLMGIYIPQLVEGSTTDLRIEITDTDIRRHINGDPANFYNNSTYTSGMRYRGFPLGHWVGTDGLDVFIRSSRYLSEQFQMSAYVEYSQRQRAQPVHETKREFSVDLTWWVSPRLRLTGGFTYQRIQNPGQITSITPYIETFANGVVANNNFIWTSLALEF